MDYGLFELPRSLCTICMRQMNDVMFRCIDKECNFMNICLRCYTFGTEIGQHKAYHEVKVIDLGTFSFCSLSFDEEKENKNIELDDERLKYFIENSLGKHFTENYVAKDGKRKYDDFIEDYHWRAMEEHTMFEALTRVGFGNWKEISNHINSTLGTNIKPLQIKVHYYKNYINGIIGRLTWAYFLSDASVRHLAKFPFYFRTNYKVKFLENQSHRKSLEDIPQQDLESIGYLAKRDDYEKEFDNEAESLISNLVFAIENEDNLEKKLKLATLEIYRRRLHNRLRKKKIIKENNLIRMFWEIHKNELSKETHQTRRDANSRISKELAEKYPNFMPYIRIMNKLDLYSLFSNLAIEQVMKILLKKTILISILSTHNLKNLNLEDKFKLVKYLSENLDVKVKNEFSNLNDIIKTSKASKSEQIEVDMDILKDMEIDEIIQHLLMKDEEPINKECFKQFKRDKSIEEITNLVAKFVQNYENEEFFKEMYNLLSCEDFPTSDRSSPEKAVKSENESSDVASSPVSSEIQEESSSDYQNLNLNDSEKKFCNVSKLEPTLFVEFKNALVKHYKKLPKASRSRLNLDNIMSKNQFDQGQKENLKKVYDYLMANNQLSNQNIQNE